MTNKTETTKKPTISQLPEQNLLNMNPVEGARSLSPVISQATNEFDYLKEKIKIQFFNLEQPGNSQKFMYGPCTDPESWTWEHGQQYEATRAQVRYVETRITPEYAYRARHDGKMVKTLTGYKPRFQVRPIWERKA